MDTALNETQQLLQQSIRDYLEKEVPFNRIREHEANGTADTSLWEYLQSAGFLALAFREEFGGEGGSLTDLAVVVEELTRRAVVIPFVETMACAATLQKFAVTDVAKSIVEGVIAGTMTLTPAIIEDPEGRFAVAAAGGKLNGEKRFVDYAQQVTHHVVSASEGGSSALYLVESGAPGVRPRNLTHIGRTPLAHVHYENAEGVRVAGANAESHLRRLLRSLTAVQCLGNSQQALDMTVDYAAMRVQFGRPIGTFQAVQHHCANMATMVLGTRFLAYEAVWKLENDTASDRDIARAKAWAAKTATEVPMMAHQVHGGIGYTEEYDLHFFSRRGKDRSTAWGSYDECLGMLADTLPDESAWQ
jgi:alkylation response protein AidB-like acyl-CoA dehydrogenase